jgi:hypothetical protein
MYNFIWGCHCLHDEGFGTALCKAEGQRNRRVKYIHTICEGRKCFSHKWWEIMKLCKEPSIRKRGEMQRTFRVHGSENSSLISPKQIENFYSEEKRRISQIRFVRRWKTGHDILGANCRVYSVKLETLYMHLSVCTCLCEEREGRGTMQIDSWTQLTTVG